MKTKVPQIALLLPRAIALFILFVQHVVQAMTNNPWFSTMAALVATTATDLAALVLAQAKAVSKVKGAVEARDDARKLVYDDILLIKSGVLSIVNQNPSQAATIIESAGLFQKKNTLPFKPELDARMAPVSPGEVLVRARAVKGASYEWQYSIDGGKTWIAMGTTTVANTSLPGMTAGANLMFRFRTTVGRTTSDWSAALSFTAR
jgi:hypothetical protein